MVMLNAENARSEDDFSGRQRPVPGRYHAVVNYAEEKGSKKKGTPGLEIEFQVLAGTPAGQAGKTIPLFLSYIGGDDSKTKTCLDRVTRLALCVGVLKPGQVAEPDWSEAVGRELVIEVEEQDYTDEKTGQNRAGSQVAFMGFWSLGNAAVADVPRDQDSPGMRQLAKSGGSATRPQAGDRGNGAKAGAGKPAATEATAKRSKFADL